MSFRFSTLHLLRSGLAVGALIAASSLAQAQTPLQELTVVSPSLQPIEASKVGSSVTATKLRVWRARKRVETAAAGDPVLGEFLAPGHAGDNVVPFDDKGVS